MAPTFIGVVGGGGVKGGQCGVVLLLVYFYERCVCARWVAYGRRVWLVLVEGAGTTFIRRALWRGEFVGWMGRKDNAFLMPFAAPPPPPLLSCVFRVLGPH